MIVDSHLHTFPDARQAPGWSDPAEFFRLVQYALSQHRQTVRRDADHAVVVEPPSAWSTSDRTPTGWRDVAFRVGRFGRFAWTIDGVDYYKQYQPVWLDPMAASAELIVALMDAVGIDRAVLQNDIYYGKLNDFFADCVRRYPERFVGTIHVDEDRAGTDEALHELRRGAGELGLRGLFFGQQQYWLHPDAPPPDDDRLNPFWEVVERLGLVVYWSLTALPLRDDAEYFEKLRQVDRVLERHPTIPSVLVGGSPNRFFEDPRVPLPAELGALVRRLNVCFEATFAISVGRTEPYPFPSAQRAVQQLVDRVGPHRVVWGSDLPNVERHCTYQQSLAYLTEGCAFLAPADRDLIVGGNLARLFRLAPTGG